MYETRDSVLDGLREPDYYTEGIKYPSEDEDNHPKDGVSSLVLISTFSSIIVQLFALEPTQPISTGAPAGGDPFAKDALFGTLLRPLFLSMIPLCLICLLTPFLQSLRGPRSGFHASSTL